MDHQIPKSLTYALGTWVHILQSFPVLPGQRLMGKRWMDSLTFCSALCSSWKCVVSCMLLTHNKTVKVEYRCSPEQDLYNPAFSHVLSKCAAWLSSMFFGTMGLFLLPGYCVLRSVSRSWFEWLFMLICVLSLLTGSLCSTLSCICCCSWGHILDLQCYCLSCSLELLAACVRGWHDQWTFRWLSNMWVTLEWVGEMLWCGTATLCLTVCSIAPFSPLPFQMWWRHP